MDANLVPSLLEEFKSNKTRSYELSEIAGHVVEFSADQYGSRFIQQKLETASTEERDMVFFAEIMPQSLTLMTDVFGNYVVQKHGSAAQIKELADQLIGRVLALSLQMYGCPVIQRSFLIQHKLQTRIPAPQTTKKKATYPLTKTTQLILNTKGNTYYPSMQWIPIQYPLLQRKPIQTPTNMKGAKEGAKDISTSTAVGSQERVPIVEEREEGTGEHGEGSGGIPMSRSPEVRMAALKKKKVMLKESVDRELEGFSEDNKMDRRHPQVQ